MNNLNQNNGMQKRMLLMTVIVFVFFIAYEYLVLKPQQEARMAQVKQEEQQKQALAPEVDTKATTVEQAPANKIDTVPTKEVSSSQIVCVIKTQKNIIEIDNLGRVAQVTLTEGKYKDDKNTQIKLFEANQLRPLEVRFADPNINEEAFKVNVVANSSNIDATQNKQELTLTQTLTNTTLTKKFTIYPDGHYDLNVATTNNRQFFITNGFRPNVLADMYAVHGFITKLNDNSLTTIADGKSSKDENFVGSKFISSFDRYYATVIYNFEKSLDVTVMPDSNSNPQAFIHSNGNISFSGYMGPKTHRVLASLNHELIDVIDYGWFTFISKPMFALLQFLQGFIGNWGWTIVALTILVKLILFPLSYKGMISMQKLKDLAPRMKEIQLRYKDDKQKQSLHMMELYKKHGANPMGGCLPLLIQIPIFFAIYRVLTNAIELKGADWIFWIKDLAAMDPFFVLPILMGVTMFVQQKITPTTVQDDMQRKIFQMLPVIFTFFFLWFPAGLTLYWFVNNLFTIGQQYVINKTYEKKRAQMSLKD